MKIKEANKIRQAKGQLKKMAKGDHHILEYGITEYSDGDIKINCSVYIHGYDYEHGTTWDEVLQGMRKQIEEA